MRTARLYLPVAVCVAVVAVVVVTRSAAGLEGLLLIAGAVLALGVLDLFSRRAGRTPHPRHGDPPADDGAPPEPPRR